ncbi:MAG: HD domain-containing protein [Magnetococcales bacterium]|nr:HD domain-containing protein [Magnetococcales bacterium]
MTHKVFRDAVHDMITLHREEGGPATDWLDWGDGMLLDLIDTPEMQRLRRIRQLGPASRVYPSAEHNRFSHALGTLHLAKRMLGALFPRGRTEPNRVEVLQVKVAALLHDLGHGPYSHVFEQIDPQAPCHEVWGLEILSGKSQVNKIIESHCKRLTIDNDFFLSGIGAILGFKQKSHPPNKHPHWGRQMISSQLDADRMDYLLRDAHFTGVSYGRYDLEWVLHSLTVQHMADGWRLCLDISRGPAALESYITARDHMYRQVYDHKTVRAFEVLLIHLFRTILWIWKLEGAPPPGIPPELRAYLEGAVKGHHKPRMVDFLALDDAVLDYAVGHWADRTPETDAQEELRWKCHLFRNRRPVYRRLFWNHAGADVGGSDLLPDRASADALELFFHQEQDRMVAVADDSGELHMRPLKLLVQMDQLERAPYAHLQYAVSLSDPIHVVDSGGVRAAEEASAHVNFLGHSRRRLARVFVDPRARGAVESLLKKRFSHPGLTLANPPHFVDEAL